MSASTTEVSVSVPRLRRIVLALLVAIVLTSALLTVQLILLRAPRTALERAVLVAERAIQDGSATEQTWAEYAEALRSLGAVGEAARVLDRAERAFPDAPPVLLARARLLFARGQESEALDALERLRDAIDARRDAAAATEEAVTEPPSRAYRSELIEGALLAANILKDEGRPDEALVWLDLALFEDPAMADVLVLRADIALLLGRRSDAIADLEQALGYVPGYGPAEERLRRLREER